MSEDDPRPDAVEIRLSLLREADLMGADADDTFDRFTRLARRLLDAPVAQLNVITADRQVPLSTTGPGPWAVSSPVSLDRSWCQHVVASGTPLVTSDAREHPLLKDTPVAREDGVVAYAGEPVAVDGGRPIGTLCVVDFRRRVWTEEELGYLNDLATGAATEIELRLDRVRRERLEARLREANSRLTERVRIRTKEADAARTHVRSILESITDRFYALDRQWRFTWVNRRAADLIGRPPEDLLGRRIWDVCPDMEGGEQHRAMESALATGQPVIFESRSMFVLDQWLEVHVYPTDEGVAVFSADITERRDAEERLRHRERQLAEAQRLAQLGGFEMDLAQGTLEWSVEAYRIFGRAPGSPFTVEDFMERVHPRSFERLNAAAEALFQHGRNFDEEYWIVREDGEERYLHGRASAERNEEGTPVRIVGTVQDITDRRNAEEALRQTEEQLRHSQKMEAVGRLAGGVAHDINNVLTAIKGYTHLMLTDLDEADDHRESALEIARSADRAAGIVRQLLAFSRRQAVELELVEANEVVASVERMMRQLIGEDVELEMQLDPDAGSVLADRGHLEQVLVNLAVNARDAMPEGGHLCFRTANAVVDEEYRERRPYMKAGPYLLISVTDTGTGIPPEILDRIFDPFFTTKDRGKGTGLGLSTVHGIVKQLGGDVWVYSEPGQGTTFKIYLPRARPAAESGTGAATLPAQSELPGGAEVVLLVDDDTSVLDVMRKALERLGYRVLPASTVADARRFAREFEGPIDLLLTDVVMPEANGTVLARELVEVRPGLRVLLASGWTEEDLARQDLVGSYMGLIEKPVDFPGLARQVREALDRKEVIDRRRKA